MLHTPGMHEEEEEEEEVISSIAAAERLRLGEGESARVSAASPQSLLQTDS